VSPSPSQLCCSTSAQGSSTLEGGAGEPATLASAWGPRPQAASVRLWPGLHAGELVLDSGRRHTVASEPVAPDPLLDVSVWGTQPRMRLRRAHDPSLRVGASTPNAAPVCSQLHGRGARSRGQRRRAQSIGLPLCGEPSPRGGAGEPVAP
jgi:hypothetical protein